MAIEDCNGDVVGPLSDVFLQRRRKGHPIRECLKLFEDDVFSGEFDEDLIEEEGDSLALLGIFGLDSVGAFFEFDGCGIVAAKRLKERDNFSLDSLG